MSTRSDLWDVRLKRIKRIAEQLQRHQPIKPLARLKQRATEVIQTLTPGQRRTIQKEIHHMPTMPVGSILLGSTRADELRGWYQTVIAPDHTGDGPIVVGGIWIIVEARDDVSETNPEPGRSIVNFHVDDFDSFEAQLEAAGVEWVARAEDRPSGRFATFKDPDGNYLQLISLSG